MLSAPTNASIHNKEKLFTDKDIQSFVRFVTVGYFNSYISKGSLVQCFTISKMCNH